MEMEDLELYLLDGVQDKPVKLSWSFDEATHSEQYISDTMLRVGDHCSPFLIVFAHGRWPDDLTRLNIWIGGCNRRKPVGELDAQSRALYCRMDPELRSPDDPSVRLSIATVLSKKEAVLGDITSHESIPNYQLTNTKHQLEDLENAIPPSAKKRKKMTNSRTPDAVTPSSKERTSSVTRRLRLSERKKSQTHVTSNSAAACTPTRMKQTPCRVITTSNKDCPSERWGHAMCPVGPNSLLLVGGQGLNQVISKDALWELSTDSLLWKMPDIEPLQARPDMRTGHTVTCDEVLGLVYVYGGSKKVKWYNDVSVLDVNSKEWSVIDASGNAPTRSYHSCTLYRGEMFVFGGVYPKPDLEPDSCSNDLFIFNSASRSWYRPIVLGPQPKPRSGHSATLLDYKLVIFGGWDAPSCFNDVHILDMGLMDFTLPDVQGTAPSPRCWHAACSLPGSQVLIHGGYDGDAALTDSFIFSLDTLTWRPVKLQGSTSSPLGARAGHTICRVTGDEGSDKIIMFGGGDNEANFFNDTQEVTIHELT